MIKKRTLFLIAASVIVSICGTCNADEPLVFVGVENGVPYSYEDNGVKKGILYDSSVSRIHTDNEKHRKA